MPPSTTKTRTSRARRKAELAHTMLGAVEALLDADRTTYTELSVERLVTAADISRSTFYTYFLDKGDLLLALTEDVIGELLEACEVWWGLPAGATEHDLRDALGEIFEAYFPHRVVLAAVVETASYDPAVRETFGALVERVVREVAAHVAQGQKDGYVDPALAPQQTAAWLTWMTERGLYQLAAPAGAAQRARLLTALTSIVWNTLYAPAR